MRLVRGDFRASGSPTVSPASPPRGWFSGDPAPGDADGVRLIYPGRDDRIFHEGIRGDDMYLLVPLTGRQAL